MIYAIIIFSFYTLKFIKDTFRMEYDQRVIIKFFLNERLDTCDITNRLQAQFGEYAYKLRMVSFWSTEIWLGRQDLHDEIRTGRSPLHDLDAKIRDISDKSLFESARSIAKTLRIAYSTMLLHLYVITWLYWLQIVPFALSITSVDAWFARKPKGVCKSDIAILACCWTW
jgi:hypothetical protein